MKRVVDGRGHMPIKSALTPVGSPLGTVRTLVTKSNFNGSPAFAEQKVYKVSYEQP